MKKIFGWIVAVIAIIGISHAGSHNNTPSPQFTSTPASSQTTTQEPQTSAPATPAPTTTAPTPTYTNTSNASSYGDDLSNDNTYTNVDGDTVHSPAYSTDNSVPTGATAQCMDGTYSFSENHRGTCSHHGGVSEWL